MRPNSNVSQFRFNSSDGFNNVQARPTTTGQTNKVMQAIPEVASEYTTLVPLSGIDETVEFGLAANLNQLKTSNKQESVMTALAEKEADHVVSETTTPFTQVKHKIETNDEIEQVRRSQTVLSPQNEHL